MTSMHRDSKLASQIWEGKPEAIREVRRSYEADPEGQFVPWVSTLYSFRSISACAQELTMLIPRMVAWVGDEELAKMDHLDPLGRADQFDVISTVLVWAAERASSEHEKSRLMERAYDAVGHGLYLVPKQALLLHTRPLLFLTRVQTSLWSDLKDEARATLRLVSTLVPHVADPNQKVRIYRKLGLLELKTGNLRGLKHLFQSLFVKDVAAAIHRKTLFFWKW